MDNDFATELALYGPASRRAPPRLAAAQAYCSRLARGHYENFTVASLLLPRRLLRHFHAVYAFCRWADDLGDETGGGQQALDLLQWWREELLRCYDGSPRHPVMVALRPTIRRFRIPPEPFLDLLLAFEQDQRVKRYQTYHQLLDYCCHSANPVGRLVLYLCESNSAENAAYADCICTGLQLANFWQDAARDLDIGRVYLPEEDRRRFGYNDADLLARRFTPQFAQLLRFEVQRARDLLQSGMPLIERVPTDVRPDIKLFARGGLAILRKIERQGYNVWAARPALGKWEKLGLVGDVVIRQAACGLAALRATVPDPFSPPEGAIPVIAELQISRAVSPALAKSYAACETIARRAASSFYPMFRLLPAPQRRAMCAVYAFLRITDDISDAAAPNADKRRQLNHWRQGLDRALAGDFTHPIYPALHDAINRHAIPPKYLTAALDGAAMDLEPATYATFADLKNYCYHVASVVGLACIHIWGFAGQPTGEKGQAACGLAVHRTMVPDPSSPAEEYAVNAGIAFQLTNILRDLGEDAAQGRVYLPREDLERFGYAAERLHHGERDDRFRELMRFEIARARGFYDAAWPLVPLLRPAGRTVFLVMARTYRALLDVMEQRDYDVFSSRVRVSKRRQLILALRALPARWAWW